MDHERRHKIWDGLNTAKTRRRRPLLLAYSKKMRHKRAVRTALSRARTTSATFRKTKGRTKQRCQLPANKPTPRRTNNRTATCLLEPYRLCVNLNHVLRFHVLIRHALSGANEADLDGRYSRRRFVFVLVFLSRALPTRYLGKIK